MRKYIFLFLALGLAFSSFAQDKMLSSKQLMSRNLYPNYPMRNVQFVGNTNTIAYIQDTVLYIGTYSNGRLKNVQPCITLSRLNGYLSFMSEERLSVFPTVQFRNNNTFSFFLDNKLALYDINTNKLAMMNVSNELNFDNIDVEYNHFRSAYTKDNNLYIYNRDNGVKVKAIEDSNLGIVYGQTVHRNEFGISKGTFWSPKGNLLAFYRMDETMVTDYPMVNTKTRIATPAPFKYPMAGMKSHEVTVGVYNVSTDKIIYLNTRKDTTVAERENFLTNVTWSPDEKHIYIAKVNRLQNHMWLESYNVETGALEKVLFEETNDRYVEPCEGLYFLPTNPNQFFWFSMRDGYKHLYLYNTDGAMLKQVTKGEYEVEGLIGFDTKGENIFLYANKDNLIGKAAYKVNLKSGIMTCITDTKGTHTVSVNPAGTLMIDICSGIDIPARAVVKAVTGKSSHTLYDSPNPLAEYAMPGIKVGTIKAADGKTDLYYRLITPPNMKQGEKYPTLVYVYGGPHSQLVTDEWLAGGNLDFLFLAQQGYVVYTLDNRGTDNRGFEFESCTHRQLGTIEMADQMEGVKFLKTLPYVDQNRMGVEGWSFGGFMTITMKLAHPEIFKVGCAGGPVIDWKWYEIMYGERYMDTPQENPEGYANNSLISKAKNLDGHLLVIHGTEDNTVVWQHSLEFLDACIKAGKQVDYFVYPHHEHNVRGYDRLHLYEKMFNYYETFLK